MANLYVDLTSGNDANNAASFANRVLTITGGITAARTAPGDVIRIMKTEDPVSIGNATWTNLSNTLTLAGALTKTIYLDGAWTAATNVTCTTSTTRKEGSNSSSIAIAAAFTTGKAAYYDLGSTQDFSSYDSITFWIRPNASVSGSVLQIKLCSDATGTTAVETFTITDALAANVWRPITINKGSALSATVRTVALYCSSDPGTVTVLIDDVLGCNANSITLTTVVSKNSSATSLEWYSIQSINGTTVKIDYAPASQASDSIRGYYGTTETVTTYKIQPVRINAVQTIQEAGSFGNVSTYSGGWNTTDMSTQTGITVIDLADGSVNGINCSVAFISFEKIVFVRASIPLNMTGADNSASYCSATGKGSTSSTGGGVHIGGARGYVANCECYCSNGYGFSAGSSILDYRFVSCIGNGNQSGGFTFNVMFNNHNIALLDCTANNNNTSGFVGNGGSFVFRNFTAKSNGASGVAGGGSTIKIVGLTTSGNGSNGVTDQGGWIRITDTNCTDTTPYSCTSRIEIAREGGDPLAFRIYDRNSTSIIAQYDTGTVHGSTSRSIKHAPVSAHTVNAPFVHISEAFAVDSSGTLTVSVYVNRTDTTKNGAKLVVRGGQVDGVSTDQTATASAANNTWEQLTVTCSPTEKVPIEVELHSWVLDNAGGANTYWGDFSVSQS